MSGRLCKQTVTLYNHAGEVDRKATYRITVLQRVFFEGVRGRSRRTSGDAANDSVFLAIFDDTVLAAGLDGRAKTYLPHRQWVLRLLWCMGYLPFTAWGMGLEFRIWNW